MRRVAQVEHVDATGADHVDRGVDIVEVEVEQQRQRRELKRRRGRGHDNRVAAAMQR